MASNSGIVGRSDLMKVDPRTIQVKEGWNPRTDYGDMEALAASITENGVLQPIILRRLNDGTLELIDGERRLRATLMAIEAGAEIKSIPAMIRNKGFAQTEALLQALVANDGKPLTSIEMAEAYRRFTAWGWTQAEIAKRVGRTQGHVSFILGLLDASPEMKEAMRDGTVKTTEAGKIIRESKKQADPVAAQREGINEAKKPKPKPAKQAETSAKTPAEPTQDQDANGERTPKPPLFRSLLNVEIIQHFGDLKNFRSYRDTKCTPLGEMLELHEQHAYNMGRIAMMIEMHKHGKTVHDAEELLGLDVWQKDK